MAEVLVYSFIPPLNITEMNFAGEANHVAVIAALNTSIAAAAAFSTWLSLDMIVKKQPSATGAATGAVVGLVAITPASGLSSFFSLIYNSLHNCRIY